MDSLNSIKILQKLIKICYAIELLICHLKTFNKNLVLEQIIDDLDQIREILKNWLLQIFDLLSINQNTSSFQSLHVRDLYNLTSEELVRKLGLTDEYFDFLNLNWSDFRYASMKLVGNLRNIRFQMMENLLDETSIFSLKVIEREAVSLKDFVTEFANLEHD